jgi:hypothetical protein
MSVTFKVLMAINVTTDAIWTVGRKILEGPPVSIFYGIRAQHVCWVPVCQSAWRHIP